MSELQIQNVLRQMRTLARTSGIEGVAPPPAPAVPQAGGANDFAAALRDSVRSVNAVQQESSRMQTRFELGDANVSLPQVMVAMNKSSVAFEATNQVRNRLLSAYQEVMSMPV